MRGHEQIVHDRRRGRVPEMVWLDDGYNRGAQRMASMGYPLADHIEVKATENPQRLDLRCLVGVPVVHVSGDDEKRVGALARACAEAGARRVIAVCHEIDRRGEAITVRMTFTNEELCQWPK